MKKNTLLILSTVFCLSSCYTYRAYDPEKASLEEVSSKSKVIDAREAEKKAKSSPDRTKNPAILDVRKKADQVSKKDELTKEGSKVVNIPTEIPTTKSLIKEKGYYQVEVFDKKQKIEAVKWEGDTLIAHVKGKPKKELKFHEKDILNLKTREFSKGRSDALTIASYASLGVGVFLLLK